MERRAETLIRAIDAALERYPGLTWLNLSIREQAEAIEREMIRLEGSAIVSSPWNSQDPAHKR